VQFDLRFYVVALVFLIFEVEVAFFFPPATIFGKATRWQAEQRATEQSKTIPREADARQAVARAFPETGGALRGGFEEKIVLTPFSAHMLALFAMVDLGIFFAVLLVGFAYVWRRGDLDWVRAVRHPTIATDSEAAVMRLQGEGQP
jgi:NADH-quinone oxidoreductase subunit A